MTLIKDKPAELQPKNDLDDIVDPDAPPPPAEIQLAGKTLTILEDPPGPGDTVVLLVRLRVYDVGTAYAENGEGEPAPYRKTKLIACWKPGSKEPVQKKTKAEQDAEAEKAAAENQPALYDDDPDAELGDTDGQGDDPEPVDPADYSPFSGDQA